MKVGVLMPSLSRRIAMSLTLVLITGMGAILGYFYMDTHGSHEAVQARTLQEQARQFISSLTPGSQSPIIEQMSQDWRKVYSQRDSGYYFTIYDRFGYVFSTSPNLVGRPPLPLADIPPSDNDIGRLHYVGPDATPTLTARLRDGRFLVVARTDFQREAFAESLLEERSEPLLVFLPFGLIALALIVFVTRQTLQPIKAASAQAADIGPTSLGKRISTERMPAELRPLVEAFNHALDRLTDAYAIEKRITANAAHELRTPLTVLSLRLQRARIDAREIDWNAVTSDLDRMNRLVAQLLDLARKEANVAPECAAVNLARVAREAALAVLPLAEERGRPINVEAHEPIVVDGDANELRDMIRNLVENALFHGDGTISVTVGKGGRAEPGFATVAVSDEGSGIPEQERSALFERFKKANPTSPGSGLGLAIVKQVAVAHGGQVRIVPCVQTTFEIILPIRR